MISPALAQAIYQELLRIRAQDWPLQTRLSALGELFERLIFEATKKEQLAFSSLFARISYLGHRHQLDAGIHRTCQLFRWTLRKWRDGRPPREQDTLLGIQAIGTLMEALSHEPVPEALKNLYQNAKFDWDSAATGQHKALARVLAIEDFPADHYFLALDQDHPDKPLRVRYNLPDRNENFNPSIALIRKIFGFPLALHLLDVQVDAAGAYLPRAFVVEPDYLTDVSAISESFKDSGADPYSYLVRKFLPYEQTEPILLGNIANFFLDRLLQDSDAPWADTFKDCFQLAPFAFAPMSDAAVRQLSGKAQKHFISIRHMAKAGLKQVGIDPEYCFLEPAFFSETYGIQGRLDLLYRKDAQLAIVELKSGTPYKPNSYGIARSHFTQALLYDLLIGSVMGTDRDCAKYMLYSGAEVNPLRFAPTVQSEQMEAIQVRNQLVAIERLLTRLKPGDLDAPILKRLRSGQGQGFTERDFARFETVYHPLSTLEKKYFNAFCGFTAREHWLAKMGEEGSDQNHGHANLWRGSFDQKQQQFSVLSDLKLLENKAATAEASIRFAKTEKTNPLANFRVGDIAVLYAIEEDADTVLRHQVIKCTITQLDANFVEVQLRYRQHNLKPFEHPGLWRLEPDLMDIGFASMYRGLFEWASAKPDRRARLLGNQAPEQLADATPLSIDKIMRSKDFFLLWGPPGTGKTSVMLRDLAARILLSTADNLLILAFTNRAVDEICEALDDIGGDIREHYLRIGGRFSTAEKFRPQLLSQKVAQVQNRAELKELLDKKRIFVSTVASFAQNDALLKIKKFQRLIVDEASQILEPQLIGLLTRFEHFTLIGDHRQLPAVSTQRIELTRVEDEDLLGIGLRDLRDAYFERLYRKCVAAGWTANYGQLNRQGRMHAALMEFPNRHFYDGALNTLSEDGSESHPQHSPLAPPPFEPESALEKLLASQRVLFLAAQAENALPNQKTNAHEAKLAAEITRFFQKRYQALGIEWKPDKSLGIITPWRAQIAQLRLSLSEQGINPDDISIDTVERYQGGARDIIVISTCCNSPQQLDSLLSLNEEGVDRKLNVALTRARQQVIVLGNTAVLKRDARYREFIEQYGKQNNATLL